MVGVKLFFFAKNFSEEHITVVLWSLFFKLYVKLQLTLTFINGFE